MKRWIAQLCAVVVMCIAGYSARATHLRAGQITAERIGCSNIFRITVTVFTDTESGIRFGGSEDVLDFGDGTSMLVPETPSTPLPGIPNLGFAKFVVTHAYPGPDTYIISYLEPNRNDFVLNVDNSVLTRFYIETKIIIDPFLESIIGCNSTPKLLVDPIDQACTGVAFFHNPGAFDPDGDSLSYEFVTPFKARGTKVDNFRFPNVPEFYTSLDYNSANENGDGPPKFEIGNDGTIKWDAPGAAGEYNIAFIIKEWRKKDGVWYELGFVRRDMQIIVSSCTNDRPLLEVPNDTCVVAGQAFNVPIPIYGTDPNGDSVKIEAFSEIFNFDKDSAYIIPVNKFQKPTPSKAKIDFYWNTTCEHVKEQSYQVVFKITDKPANGPRLVTFETWNITVIPPPPVWISAVSNPAARTATLDWESYACSDDVENVKIQIWRKVDAAPFTPDDCETGMPEFLGYTLIKEVPATQIQYVDKNLAVGAKYCYRLVAVYPLPRGGESVVSDEVCVDPILADAPVITNVSVDRTGTSDGALTIRWLEPFEIDDIQFPPPYKYVVQRSESIGGPFLSGLVHTGQLDALSAQDLNINTEEKTFYYRILLYVPSVSVDPVDTSSIASMVRLDLAPQTESIELRWNAFVPWSNQIQTAPNHDLFKGPEGAVVNSDLAPLTQVNVFVNGQLYTDDGPLDENTVYCYQVLTRGGYGNPNITEPLENYSQIACATPSDSIPPCKLELLVKITDCEDFVKQSCDFSEYENTIYWARTSSECDDADIKHYRIYYSGTKDGEFLLLADNVVDTFYVDKNLSSYARCYRIAAVDRSGNEGEWSDAVCSENCPYYELPNIFTPNGDGYNDTFSAFSTKDYEVPPCEECPEGEKAKAYLDYLTQKCARFVEKVRLKMFNRWGKEVYTFESGGEGKTIYIDWDGRDDVGRELASGVYYYSAEVKFTTADPSKSVKVFKGWVHLQR